MPNYTPFGKGSKYIYSEPKAVQRVRYPVYIYGKMVPSIYISGTQNIPMVKWYPVYIYLYPGPKGSKGLVNKSIYDKKSFPKGGHDNLALHGS